VYYEEEMSAENAVEDRKQHPGLRVETRLQSVDSLIVLTANKPALCFEFCWLP
jgi:hypothetical protein